MHAAHLSCRELEQNAECPASPPLCICSRTAGWSDGSAWSTSSFWAATAVKWVAGASAVEHGEGWTATQQAALSSLSL